MNLPNLRRIGALGAALVLLSAACGDESGSSDASKSSAQGTGDEQPTITIVTYSSYVLDEKVQAKVEADLGVRIEVKATGDAAEALSGAILTAGRPEGDIFFGVDNTLLSRAVAGEAFEPPAEAPANLSTIPDRLRLDESGVLFPVDVGPVCVDYDAQWFEEHELDPPTSFEDLAAPEYRGLLVAESPVTSSPGLVFLMAIHEQFGDGAADFLQRLVDNGMSVAGSWDDAWGAQYTVSGGDRPLVVSYASSPPAEVFYSEGTVETPRTKVIEATCAEQIEFAGVLSGTEHPDEAAKVLDAMLGDEWQSSLPLANFVYPANPDAAEPELFAKFAPRPATMIELDPSVIEERRDGWIDEWRSIAE